jgi:putative hemolysin
METSLLTVSSGDLLMAKNKDKSKNIHQYMIDIKQKYSRELVIMVFVADSLFQYGISFILNLILSQYSFQQFTLFSITMIFSFVHIFISILIKSFAISYAMRCIEIFKYPYYVIFKFSKPMITQISRFSDSLLKNLKVNPTNYKSDLSAYKYEIVASLEKNQKFQETLEEVDMIKSVLNLRDTTIEYIMTPRNEFIMAEYSDNIEVFKINLLAASWKRYIIVYSKNKDNIMGYINIQDFFIDLSLNKVTDVKYYIHPPKFFIYNLDIFSILKYFQRSMNKFIFTTDEYGNICGIVTLTDVMTEIVGEVDEDQYYFEQIGNIFIVEGSYSLRLLNRKMDWSLPDHSITIGGLLLSYAKRIPKYGEEFTFDNLVLSVHEIKRNKINKVKIICKEKKLLNASEKEEYHYT